MTGIPGLTFAALTFLALHVVVAGTPVRAELVRLLGERVYRILFGIASAAVLAWMGWAYGRAPFVPLWEVPGAAHLALAVMPFAWILAVAAFTAPNPTAIGGGPPRPDQVSPVARVTRHPFLWAVALWAAVHLLANGDLSSLLLFGTLLVVALAGMALIDARRHRTFGPTWEAFAARTSVVPFAAILGGRARLTVAEFGWWRIGLGLAFYAAFLAAHRVLFGVAPLGG